MGYTQLRPSENRKLDSPLNSFKTNAASFSKLATDVVVVKLFIKFYTARESNDRQTFDWIIKLNSKLVPATLWTYQTLNECINAFVMILPIEKCKLLNQADLARGRCCQVLLFSLRSSFNLLLWFSVPRSLPNLFTATNSKDLPTVDGKNSAKCGGNLLAEY